MGIDQFCVVVITYLIGVSIVVCTVTIDSSYFTIHLCDNAFKHFAV